MRRVIAIVAGAVLTAGLAGSVLAGQNGQGGPSLNASGWRLSPSDNPTVQFAASAQFSAGGHAIGTYRFGNFSGNWSAAVTCGSIEGNVAVIGGRLTDGSGNDFLVWLIDNGSPTFGLEGPDAVSLTGVGPRSELDVYYPDIPGDFPTHCPPAAGQGFDQALADGLRTVIGNVSISGTGGQNGQ